MIRFAIAALALLPLVSCTTSAAADLPPATLIEQDWLPKAPPLPDPKGQVLEAKTVGQLFDAAKKLEPGGTILVADGHYQMPRSLYIRTKDATLRSESGDRSKVVLDFKKSRHGEGVCISDATGVTVADLTVANVYWNAIKINSNHDVDRATIYNVVSHNCWQRHIKGPGVPDKNGKPQYNEGSRVQYCLFYNDRPKRPGDDPAEDRAKGGRFGYNYIGGMDIMRGKGWTVSDNVFVGIHGKTREGRGAIFMWHNCRDCVIERNIIIDCDSGICLGNSSARGKLRHAENMIVRNNFITRCPESNILADHTRDCRILHNTVHDPKSRLKRLIRVIHANDGLVVRNNIFSGPGTRIAGYTGEITVADNLVRVVPSYFVDPKHGDLHLTHKATLAIDKVKAVDDVEADIDGEARGDKPDLGADELAPPDEG